MPGLELRYLAVAVTVNCAWFAGLTSVSRDFFLRTLELGAWEFFGLLQVAGCGVAFAFRGPILRASARKSVALGFGLPFVGLYVFIASMLTFKLFTRTLGGGDVATSLIYGPFYIVSFGYVVFPLGIASQFLMRWVGTRGPSVG